MTNDIFEAVEGGTACTLHENTQKNLREWMRDVYWRCEALFKNDSSIQIVDGLIRACPIGKRESPDYTDFTTKREECAKFIDGLRGAM